MTSFGKIFPDFLQNGPLTTKLLLTVTEFAWQQGKLKFIPAKQNFHFRQSSAPITGLTKFEGRLPPARCCSLSWSPPEGGDEDEDDDEDEDEDEDEDLKALYP